MSAGRAVLLIIVVATIVRLILAGSVGLGVDESYMVGNARVLSLSYVDHPPLHVWLAGLAARLFGTESAFAVRLPFVLLFAGSTWLMFRLTSDLFGATAGLFAALAFNLVPVFSLAHASWVLPDGPLIFFLLAAATLTARILFADPQPARPMFAWIAAGALGGLALLSKYSAIFFFIGVLIFLFTTPAARRFLATPGPWLGALVAVLLFIPVVVWNAENGMAGFAFQGGRLSGLPAPNGSPFLVNTLGQAAYLSPWLFLFLLYAFARALRAGPSEPRGWFIGLQALGPIAVFTVLSLWVRSLPHWPMPGWLFVLPLLGREAARFVAIRPRLMLGATGVTIAAFAIILAAASLQAIHGGVLTAGPDGKAIRDPTVDLIDWTALRDALKERGMLDDGTAVATHNWLSAGKASYALGPEVPVLCLCRDPHHFPFRLDDGLFVGRDVVIVFPDYEKERALASLEPHFESVTPLQPVEIRRNGETVLTLDLMLGHNLKHRAAE